jgi:simple sugar transport system permease protein
VSDRLRAGLWSIGISSTAAILALGASLAIIAASGHSPLDALETFADGAFGGRAQVGGTLSKMVPLALVACGWIVAFSARRINVGFEGQIIIGSATATVIGLEITGLPLAVHLPLSIVGGAVGGAMLAGVAAYLWAWRGVNEVISTLLLNFVAIQFLSWLIRNPLAREGFSIRTDSVEPSARWPSLLSQTPLAWDLVLVFLAVAGAAFLLQRTVLGLRIRLAGANEPAARHAGIDTVRTSVIALLLSGALAGIAGSSLVLASETHSLSDGISAGFGFEGIVVALLARNSPAGVIPAALVFAIFRQSGGLLEARHGIASELVLITQGLVVLLVAGAAFLVDRRRSFRVDMPGTQPVRDPAGPAHEPTS